MGGKFNIPTAVRFGVVEALFCGCVSDSLSSDSMISEVEKLNSVSSQGQDWYGKEKTNAARKAASALMWLPSIKTALGDRYPASATSSRIHVKTRSTVSVVNR